MPDDDTRESSPSNAAPPSLSYADADSDLDVGELNVRADGFDIAVVALRLLGIYLLLQGSIALTLVGNAIRSLFFGGGRQGVLDISLQLLPFAICLAAGVSLLKAAPALALRLLPRRGSDASAGERPATGSRSLQALGFSIAGAIVVAQAVPRFCYSLTLTFIRNYDVYSRPRQLSDFLVTLLQPTVEIALGVWLFFGSKGLAHYWHRIRHPELHQPEPASELK
jgi:hypothetical protein